MKTSVRAVMVKDENGLLKEIVIRMPNGDLKRRFLVSLLKQGALVPTTSANKLLFEVLAALDTEYRREASMVRLYGELVDDYSALEANMHEIEGDYDDLQIEHDQTLQRVEELEHELIGARDELDTTKKLLNAYREVLYDPYRAVNPPEEEPSEAEDDDNGVPDFVPKRSVH